MKFRRVKKNDKLNALNKLKIFKSETIDFLPRMI